MEELIFFAVIIFFSILESIARSRKSKGGGAEGPLPDPAEWEAELPELEPSGSRRGQGDVRSYDDLESYDDAVEGPVGPPASSRPRPSSETMLPGDLLEQLEALARGRTMEREEATTIDLPKQSPPLPTPVERTEVGTGHASTDPVGTHNPYRPPGSRGLDGPVGSTAPIGSRPPVRSGAITRRPDHFVHQSHAGYGTDPSSRPPSEQDGLDPLAEYLDDDGVRVRGQLFGGRQALRQAFILKEVLGPPKALREDDSVF